MGSGLLVVHHEPVVPVVALHDRRCAQVGTDERGRRGFRTPRRRRIRYRRRISALVGDRLGPTSVIERLWFVFAGRTFTEGWTVGGWQVESSSKTVVLLLEFGDARLESL